MSTVTYYACTGHPDHAEPLVLFDYDEAIKWFVKHKNQYPVAVEKIVTSCETIRNAEALFSDLVIEAIVGGLDDANGALDAEDLERAAEHLLAHLVKEGFGIMRRPVS